MKTVISLIAVLVLFLVPVSFAEEGDGGEYKPILDSSTHTTNNTNPFIVWDDPGPDDGDGAAGDGSGDSDGSGDGEGDGNDGEGGGDTGCATSSWKGSHYVYEDC